MHPPKSKKHTLNCKTVKNYLTLTLTLTLTISYRYRYRYRYRSSPFKGDKRVSFFLFLLGEACKPLGLSGDWWTDNGSSLTISRTAGQ